MASSANKGSKKISNPHRLERRRGIKPGDKLVNRTGGTAPSQIVSNPARIDGIKKAFVAAVASIVGENSPVIYRVKFDLHMPDDMWTEVEDKEYARVIGLAKKRVPDWAKLPEEHRPGLAEVKAATPQRRHVSQPGPRITSGRRISIAPVEVETQMAKTLRLAQEKEERAKARSSKATEWTGVKTLAPNRDLAALKRVAHVTRSAS